MLTERESTPIAVVQGPGETVQSLFAVLVRSWRPGGIDVAGVIAEPHNLPDRSCAAGILRNVVSGETFPMYLATVPVDISCHLDARGVDAACASVVEQLRNADIVVLSKFGKLEAEGKGLWPAFQASLMAGKPIMTTVSSRHEAAWRAFAPHAVVVDADEEALTAWRHRLG